MTRAHLVVPMSLVVLVAGCTSSSTNPLPGDTGASPVPSAAAPTEGTDPVIDDAAEAQVVAVLDGDSLEIRTERGVEEVRLLGINTPERFECWDQEARAATRALVSVEDIALARRGTDRYGRVLAYLVAADSLVNLRLVAEGHATALTTDHEFLEEFLDAEQAAFEARIGLWAPDACGAGPTADVRIAAVVADPPGRDDDPETGEHVEIRNEGPTPVDLTGWVLRDESTTHRFEFPGGMELGAGESIRVFSVCGVHPLCFGYRTVWSNEGDLVLLLDAERNVADRRRYRDE